MKYDPALDGLRSIAVGSVVIFHANPQLLPGGWAGVDIFFVLSGFLITTILKTEMETSGALDLRRFYLRRALRLTPALLLLLGASLVLAAFQKHQFRDALEASAFTITYTMNWNRAFHWGPQWALGHTWSLGMEEQFYILWPTFLLFVRRGARIPATVMLIVAIVAWRCYLVFQGVDPERTYNGFDTHADALLLGCVLAFAGDRLKLPANGVWSILAVVGTGLLFALMEHRTIFAQTAGLSIAGLLSVLVIVCARQPGWLRNLLQLPPLVFTGRISYGIYLWHYVLLTVTRSHFPGLLLCVPIAMAYLAAVASFFIVEQPILRLKNRWRTAAYRPAEQSGPLRLSES